MTEPLPEDFGPEDIVEVPDEQILNEDGTPLDPNEHDVEDGAGDEVALDG
jgi:hypothetical protein